MSFAVVCKSCQARFLLNDDLLRRKVAGKVVTVRCRQCHASIEVDASDVDPQQVGSGEKHIAAPEPPPPTALGKIRAPKPAPAPPRPAAKSTLMGIGTPRPAAASNELVALSPLMSAGPSAVSAQGFPEPPPPPGALEVLDPRDWEIEDTATPTIANAKEDAAPESVDDFIEELPPSVPPEDEMPSSAGTPSLKALTHHDHAARPPSDDFLANMTAAMNGGIPLGAPTIDVSDLAPPARNAKTLPLFDVNEDELDIKAEAPPMSTPAAPPVATAPPARQKSAEKPAAAAAPAAATPAEGSLSPAAIDPPSSRSPDSPRERKNVVAPATKSVRPAAARPRRSGFAAPLLLALAAAAGFLIWKRGGAEATSAPRAEPPTELAAVTPAPTPATLPAAEPAPTASIAAAAAPAPGEELTFETTPAQQAPATPREKPLATPGSDPAAPAAAAATPKPEDTPAVVKEEPTPDAKPAPEEPSEPAGPFDRAAAASALTASAAQASACRKDGDPSGVASVVVTFAPSGRVTSANISGPPYAGTPTGGCIAAALRKTRIPAFDGDRVTVSKTVVIQ